MKDGKFAFFCWSGVSQGHALGGSDKCAGQGLVKGEVKLHVGQGLIKNM